VTHRTLFPRWSAIALIAVAVLASSAALGVPVSPDVHAAVASFASPGERSVGRVNHEPSEPRGTVRTAILRANATVLSSLPAPGGTGPSSTRGIAALGAASARLALAVLQMPRERIDVRRDGVPSAAQPTPPSRAPPLA
jgi:hypothetical protein